METQKGTQWCWAAVAISFQNHLHTGSRTQCVLARDLLPNHNGHDCCVADPPLPECNKEAPLLDALTEVGVHATPKGGTLLFSDIVTRVKAKELIACVIHFSSALINHFVQIDGVIESTRELIVNDPLRHEVKLSMTDMLTNYNKEGGTWTQTLLIG
jgi:hypothetical protein